MRSFQDRPSRKPLSIGVTLGIVWIAVTGTLGLTAGPARAATGDPVLAPAAGSIDTTLEAGEADAVPPKRQWVKWNELDGPVTTFRFGYGLLLEGATYVQDSDAKQQVATSPDVGVRDFRLLFRGKFKTQRPFSWTLGYMYDGANKDWRFRQTGIMVGVPELSGRFFLGRTKEGYSTSKVMVGYNGWGIERSQTLDAFVPILADGIKYLGYWKRQRMFLDLGAYGDAISEAESFSTYDDQIVARWGWQPILSDQGELLHVAVMTRYATPDNGKLREKSRPGAYLAPPFLDTGSFAADHSDTYGVEAFYQRGPWLFGSEYDVQRDRATDGRTPVFQGGDVSAIWLITGETRPYNATGGFFEAVSPRKSVFDGGMGAVEAVLNLTYNDFDDAGFTGGKFWRVTPMVNWHMADFLRLEFVYGYGVLDRFGTRGTTQFFQTRIQTCY